MRTILFIDGENFLKKVKDVFESQGKSAPDFHLYNFRGLFDKVLDGVQIDEGIFYFAKLREHQNTIKKSRQLIDQRRLLKTHLENTGFRVIIKGNVRGQLIKNHKGKEVLIFKEKGVDVKIAVDMVSFSCDGKIKTAVIASSDSDLQPAIEELMKRNIERIYLGFEHLPNKGLTYTTNRTILIRNSEIMKF